MNAADDFSWIPTEGDLIKCVAVLVKLSRDPKERSRAAHREKPLNALPADPAATPEFLNVKKYTNYRFEIKSSFKSDFFSN